MGYEIERYNRGNSVSFFEFAGEIWPDDPRKRNPGYIAWLYGDGTNRESNLILFLHDRRVVGSLGTFPVRWKCGDKVHSALWVADFYLLPEYRNKGLGVLLLKEAESRAEVLLTTGMSESAETLYRKLKWMEFDRGDLFLLLRDARAILSRNFGSTLIKFIVRIGAVPFFRLRSLLGGRRPRTPVGVEIRQIDHRDSRISGLWKKWEKSVTAGGIRSPEWIAWRYASEPSPNRWVLAAEKGSDCVGVVFLSLDEDHNGFRRARILDFFWDPDLPEICGAILNEGVRLLLSHSPAYITTIASLPEPARILNRLGFVAVQGRPVMLKGVEVPPDALWHFTMGDSDSGLGP